ncbi:glycoside hydrolase superfamily [Mycena filopes]|nr:glycoside hydrolase superfamily [Mycena filopes]
MFSLLFFAGVGVAQSTFQSATLTGLGLGTDDTTFEPGREDACIGVSRSSVVQYHLFRSWNSWNAYACNINEAKIIAAANQFVSLGLKAAGYQYINIDDCWSVKGRNATNKQIIPDAVKFPKGISGVATQVHSLGLKFGIYSDAGTATCAGFPGSLGFEAIDAATFNAWGVDYLKYDNCNIPANWSDAAVPQDGDWYNSNSAIRYRQMTAALSAQPRPAFIASVNNVWDWGSRVGHSWPTAWALMEIGNGALTIQEQRTHFAAWIMLKSPILLGTDVRW